MQVYLYGLKLVSMKWMPKYDFNSLVSKEYENAVKVFVVLKERAIINSNTISC